MRKLSLILKSKSVECDEFKLGSRVKVLIKSRKEKKCKCTELIIVLKFDKASGTITVSCSKGRKILAAVEDVRKGLPGNCFRILTRTLLIYSRENSRKKSVQFKNCLGKKHLIRIVM